MQSESVRRLKDYVIDRPTRAQLDIDKLAMRKSSSIYVPHTHINININTYRHLYLRREGGVGFQPSTDRISSDFGDIFSIHPF